MGWIDRVLERRRLRALMQRIARIRATPPDARLENAIAEIARAMPLKALGRRHRGLHAPLVLILARQRADANMRLSSSHFSSGGHNVGMDVLMAEGRARVAIVASLSRKPAVRRPLSSAVTALDDLIAAQREAPGDPDGYGIATLHEIRRDLAKLALSER